MSHIVLGKILEKVRLPAPQMLLLLAIGDNVHDDGAGYYASDEYLEWKTGMPKSTIQKIKREWREAGVLVPVGFVHLQSKTEHLCDVNVARGTGGRGWSVMYKLDIGPLPKKQPWEQVRGKKVAAAATFNPGNGAEKVASQETERSPQRRGKVAAAAQEGCRTGRRNKEESSVKSSVESSGGNAPPPLATLAGKVTRECCLPENRQMLQAVSSAIRFCMAMEGRSQTEAVEFLVAQVREEISGGGSPTAFWFDDRKWRECGAVGSAAQKQQRILESSLRAAAVTSKADRKLADISPTTDRVFEQAQHEYEPVLPAGMDAGLGHAAWKRISDWLKDRTTPHAFDTWLKPLRAIGALDGGLYVRIPTKEFHHIEDKFGDLMGEAVQQPAECRIERFVFLTADEQREYFQPASHAVVEGR